MVVNVVFKACIHSKYKKKKKKTLWKNWISLNTLYTYVFMCKEKTSTNLSHLLPQKHICSNMKKTSKHIWTACTNKEISKHKMQVCSTVVSIKKPALQVPCTHRLSVCRQKVAKEDQQSWDAKKHKKLVKKVFYLKKNLKFVYDTQYFNTQILVSIVACFHVRFQQIFLIGFHWKKFMNPGWRLCGAFVKTLKN